MTPAIVGAVVAVIVLLLLVAIVVISDVVAMVCLKNRFLILTTKSTEACLPITRQNLELVSLSVDKV